MNNNFDKEYSIHDSHNIININKIIRPVLKSYASKINTNEYVPYKHSLDGTNLKAFKNDIEQKLTEITVDDKSIKSEYPKYIYERFRKSELYYYHKLKRNNEKGIDINTEINKCLIKWINTKLFIKEIGEFEIISENKDDVFAKKIIDEFNEGNNKTLKLSLDDDVFDPEITKIITIDLNE